MKRPRKRAIMKQLDKRYYKAINEARERGEYRSALILSGELLQKTLWLLKEWREI